MATATATKKKIKFRPTDDRVLVEPSEAEDKTSGGIILPDTAKEKPREGKVIGVGPGKILDSGKKGEMTVKKGDRILFASYAGTEIKVDGEEYIIMDESDILGIVD